MLSLRRRLTLSYAVLVAVVLGAVVLVATRFAFEAIAHPMIDATESAFKAVQVIAINGSLHHQNARQIELTIVKNVRTPNVDVRVISHGPGRGPGPNGGPPPGFGPRRPLIDLSRVLGLPFHVLHVGGDEVFVTPNLAIVNAAIGRYLQSLGAGIVLALVLSWVIARWITAQAIRPLTTVTAELRRFAAGDFTPSTVTTSDRDELGALIEAYNGAAAKVGAAFEERLRLEEHMRRFVADAGHELRTPLTVIGGYLQILRKAAPDDLAVRDRALNTLDVQSARMRALVERLMALVRLEAPIRCSGIPSTWSRSRAMRSTPRSPRAAAMSSWSSTSRRGSPPTRATCTRRSATSSTTRSSTAAARRSR